MLIVVAIIVIKTPLLIDGWTRADLKHCGKAPGVREELNRSERIEYRHSIKGLQGMISRSHDLGEELITEFVELTATVTKHKAIP